MPKYTINGKDVSLSDKDFLAKGGEKSIYVKKSIAYCLYHDPTKMIPDGKFKELATLDDPRIFNPQHIVLDARDRKVGFTTLFLEDAVAVCQLFTKAFKLRNHVTNDMSLELVKKFYDLVSHIHDKNILIVDLNELNFLVDDQFRDIYGIDVNSYQTKRYLATAIMESVRDRQAAKWTQETDWFSWGVVTFQMLIGIHPYKGAHPDYEGAPIDRMEARMQDNCSAFNPKSILPTVCESLDIIPPALRGWYKAVFEEGKRIVPPMNFETVANVVVAVKISGSNNFVIDKIFESGSDIIGVYVSGPTRVIVGTHHLYCDEEIKISRRDVQVGFTTKQNTPIAAWIEKGQLELYNIQSKKKIGIVTKADAITQSDGRILVKNGPHILEVVFTEFSSVIASVKQVGQVLPQATKLYEGVAIQNMLGRYVASLFPASGRCEQLKLPELDNYKIIDAKYDNKVLVVVGAKEGKYDRFVFRISSTYKEYSVRVVEDITTLDINFTVGDNGTVVLMNGENVEAFSNNRHATQVKIFDPDSAVSGVKLFHDGADILFARGKELYSITMK